MLLEVQILGSHPRPKGLETLSLESSNLYFNKPAAFFFFDEHVSFRILALDVREKE